MGGGRATSCIRSQVDEEGVSRLDAQQKAEECLLRHNEEAARLQLLQERIACLERIMATVRSDAEACAERLTQAGHQKALLQHNAGVRDRVVQGGHAALQQFRQALAVFVAPPPPPVRVFPVACRCRRAVRIRLHVHICGAESP